jgi:DNA-binding protein HU-beta
MADRAELVGSYNLANLAVRAQVTGRDARALMDQFIRVLETMRVGDKLTIQNLGVFEKVMSKERPGSNPKTAERFTVPARERIRFRASKNLRRVSG